MRLYLFDDAVADGWAPFSLTRPIGELRFGALLLRERIEAWTGLEAEGHLVGRRWLDAYEEPDAPAVLAPESPPPDAGRLLVSSRFVPDAAPALAIDALADAARPVVLLADGAVAGCFLPPGVEPVDGTWLAHPGPLQGAGEHEVAGLLLAAPWDLVRLGSERTARDVGARAGASGQDGRLLPDGVWRIGNEPLVMEPGVGIEPGVVLDLRYGPIGLGRDVQVRAGCRLQGPVWAGAGTRLLGGPISGLATGPASRFRGEVADTQAVGWINKAHEGHLGHALLGRWINLGAGTTNSDLKNNYGSVRVGPPGREVDTGLLKLGCLVGDHVKTAIGTMLDTGSVLGAGANLFGPGRPPRWVPPFAWGFGEGARRYRREAFLATAAVVMERRGTELTAGARRWLAAVWDAARDEGDA
jgi:UDP-N-acetylglucosamine diphosphorylase / glucose-1-phosphate thymidylyltransferase / UDP-N-acetylgalactosamine diphosphorylase / glucosamine-1-phosphate N-acetyltransferase / galactosamine-1-phosphate N-acetyltransferase